MSSTQRRSRGARLAGSTALGTVLVGAAVALACGGESETPFHDPLAAGDGGVTSSGGSAGKGATVGGSAGAGNGAGTTGGSGGDAMSGGSGGAVGGSAGEAMSGASGGGTAGSGAAPTTGGSAGEGATGGSGGMTGGSGGDTATGGTGGNATGGTAGTGAASGAGGNATGGAAGSGAASGKGGTGGTAGKGGSDDCDALQGAASDALARAQVCSFTAGGRQCTGTVEDLCGCQVPVNNMSSEATEKYLAARAAAKGCVFLCPAVVCVEPDPDDVTCVRTSAGDSTGRCRTDGIAIQPF
jgi:hypothetical protein